LLKTQVYFKMLDALLAEESISEEMSGQTQVCQLLMVLIVWFLKMHNVMDPIKAAGYIM